MQGSRVLGAIGAVLALGALAAPPAAASSLPEAPDCPMFPADSWWHSDISALPVHPQSDAYVASIGVGGHVHADFGSGLWNNGPIGIPYVAVAGTQPAVAVTFDYDGESDHGAYRVPPNAPIEGGPASQGDRHILVVDRDRCQLAELYAAYPNSDGSWHAGSGAIWDLRANDLRPDGWTSADAAGLPILPGLVRRDEVAHGYIDHAIRITASVTAKAHIWPARHDAGSTNGVVPMGLRLRLKAGFDISGYPSDDRVILQAMKTFGVVVADNGSSWFISGVPDPAWDNDVLHTLGQVGGSAFEAVDSSSLMVDPNSGQVAGGPAPIAMLPIEHGDPANPQPLGDAGPAGAGPTTAPPETTAPVSTDVPTSAPATTAQASSPAVAAPATVARRTSAGRGWWRAFAGLALAAAAAVVAWARVRVWPRRGEKSATSR